MIVILRDTESRGTDAIFVTETTTAKQIQNIIDDTKIQVGNTYNYLWEEVVGKLPSDVKVYTDWQSEFETIYW